MSAASKPLKSPTPRSSSSSDSPFGHSRNSSSRGRTALLRSPSAKLANTLLYTPHSASRPGRPSRSSPGPGANPSSEPISCRFIQALIGSSLMV